MSAISRMLGWLCDPVPQDKYAVLFSEYKGVAVRLVPVLDSDPAHKGRVIDWIVNPDDIKEIDASQQAARPEPQKAATVTPTQPSSSPVIDLGLAGL